MKPCFPQLLLFVPHFFLHFINILLTPTSIVRSSSIESTSLEVSPPIYLDVMMTSKNTCFDMTQNYLQKIRPASVIFPTIMIQRLTMMLSLESRLKIGQLKKLIVINASPDEPIITLNHYWILS